MFYINVSSLIVYDHCSQQTNKLALDETWVADSSQDS